MPLITPISSAPITVSTVTQINSIIKSENKMSIIHFDTRSLYVSFNSIRYYLSGLLMLLQYQKLILINSERSMDSGIECCEIIERM